MLESMKAWRAKNREHYNAYQRWWRATHQENVADYYAKRRRPKLTKTCPRCNTEFQVNSGPQKFCSARCREISGRAKPERQEKQRIRARIWREKNRESSVARSKAWYNKFYKENALKLMRAQPWAPLLKSRKRYSIAKGLVFELDEAWAAARWTGRCEVTNLDFAPPEKRVGYKNRNFTPSIDRIDPKGAYTKDNCRFVLWAINSFKRDSSDRDMYKIAIAMLLAKGFKLESPVRIGDTPRSGVL